MSPDYDSSDSNINTTSPSNCKYSSHHQQWVNQFIRLTIIIIHIQIHDTMKFIKRKHQKRLSPKTVILIAINHVIIIYRDSHQHPIHNTWN